MLVLSRRFVDPAMAQSVVHQTIPLPLMVYQVLNEGVHKNIRNSKTR